jgi:hypothetical protein
VQLQGALPAVAADCLLDNAGIPDSMQVAYVIEGWPGVTAVPVGAFADPDFPSPGFSVYEHRKHSWTCVLGEDVEHTSSPGEERDLGVSIDDVR